MQINRDNFEAYFLDCHEQRLSAEQVAELMVFLEMNPDLQDEFDAFEPVLLEPEEMPALPGKKQLKRKIYLPVSSINALNYEQWMVASLEGDLNADEQTQFRAFLDLNPGARLEWAIFNKTLLVAGSEVFPEKETLRKHGFVLFIRKPALAILAVAASLILLFGLARLLFPGASPVHHPIKIAEINFRLPEKGAGQFSGLAQFSEKPIEHRNRFEKTLKITEGNQALVSTPILPPSKIEPLAALEVLPTGSDQPDEILASMTFNQPLVFQTFENSGMPSPKSFMGRFVAGAISRVFGPVPNLNKSILEYTIDGYNLMADREVEIEKQYNAQGKVVAYNLDGGVVHIGRRIPAGSRE